MRVRRFTERTRISACTLSAALALILLGCERAPSPAERAQPYAYHEVAAGPCAAGFSPRDPTLPSASLITADHLKVQIRAPTNYRATVPHPLLVVYAAAGMSVENNERFTGITAKATAAGWLVAFVAHVRASLPAMQSLAKVPTRVAAQWCVDPHRIYLTGHSDGGTATTAIALQSAPPRDRRHRAERGRFQRRGLQDFRVSDSANRGDDLAWQRRQLISGLGARRRALVGALRRM